LPDSPSLAVKFGGKVYRTLDPSSSYARDGNLFGEPDERVEDLDAERGEKRRHELERNIARESPLQQLMRGDDEEDSRGRRTAMATKVTPTKRKIVERSPSPPRRSNPFSAQRESPPSLGLPFSDFRNPSTSSEFSSILPPPLASLVALHTVLESALVLLLACDGSAVASATSQTNAQGEAILRMPNLITFNNLQPKIETSGKRFSEAELAKLVWVWEGCGRGEGSMPTTPMDELDDDELKVEKKEVGGMGFLITESRTRNPTTGSTVSTYGIGISVALRANPQLPTFELLPPRSPTSKAASGKRVVPPSPGSVGSGRQGMSVVALWSQGKDGRVEEFARRLREWADDCSRRGKDFTVIPRATLPTFAAAIHNVAGTTSPKKKAPTDVFGPAIHIAAPNFAGGLGVLVPAAKVVSKGSVEERRQALAARLQAKANAGHSAYLASISSLTAGGSTVAKSLKRDKNNGSDWRLQEKELFMRNSLLSRLGNVADSVWMCVIPAHQD
ncbi:hypothetical protein P7C70_g9198, partial [Phenoliferia sp. Uapishka_3]